MKKFIPTRQPTAGFTMIEIIVIVLLISALSALAIPSWLQFVTQRRLNEAQDRALLVLRDAQAKSKQSHGSWQACLRDNGTQVDSAVEVDCSSASANWQHLISSNDSRLIAMTTANLAPTNGYYVIQYQADSTVNQSVNPAPEFIFAIRNQSGGSKTCFSVLTILGAVHTDQDTHC